MNSSGSLVCFICLASLLSGALARAADSLAAGATRPAAAPATAPVAGPSGAHFVPGVMPMLDRLGCNAASCHGFAQSEPKAIGLALSLFGGDAERDYGTILRRPAQGKAESQQEAKEATPSAKEAPKAKLVDPAAPEKSLLLLKITGGAPHKGGKKVEPGSADYNMLVAWISQGARFADEKASPLTGIQVLPVTSTMGKGQSASVKVTALYADGTVRDVTADARCWSSDAKTLAVTPEGTITAQDYGEAAVAARYLRKFAVSRVAVPQPLPNGFLRAQANNGIDKLVNSKLEKLGIPPSPLCTDQQFLRRVYLDVIGTLPTPDETRVFLADKGLGKRGQLIDKLLERPEYADYCTLKWGDLLRIRGEDPVALWPLAAQAYSHWVRESISRNKPYGRFVRELLTATGSCFNDPPVNYHRAIPSQGVSWFSLPSLNPNREGELTALLFLGRRISCARCHAHPEEIWSPEDTRRMGAFFSQMAIKRTKEYKEDVITLNLLSPMEPLALPDGRTVAIKPGEDARAKLADWLTDPRNPGLAEAVVNRIWCWLLGRGIVHEPDDVRSTNPPSNPELLAYLEAELVGHSFDLKHVYRLILNSRTYQLSSEVTEWNANDVAQFSHYPVRRLEAEVLIDAICQVTGGIQRYGAGTPAPPTLFPVGWRAIQINDGQVTTGFMQLFGRPARASGYESERDHGFSGKQALFALNGEAVLEKIESGTFLRDYAAKGDAEFLDELYLRSLTRFPTEEERSTAIAYLKENAKTAGQSRRDLVWALLNANEFMFNH